MSDRADRLGAAMLLFGLVGEPAADALTRQPPLLTRDEWAAWRATDDDDVALARACLTAEHELREVGWGWLEFLLHVQSAPDAAAAPVSAGAASATDAAESMVLIPRAQAVAVAIQALGWHLPPPPEGV